MLKSVLISCIFPPRCPVCGGLRFPWEAGTCADCLGGLHYIREPVCMGCGREVSWEEEEYCPECQKQRPVVERNFAVWQYDKRMKQSIADFKYAGRTEYARFYARSIAKYYGERLLRLGITVLVPVPCSVKRQRYRGYNQAEVLAGVLARELGVEVLPLLRRTKETLPQNALAPKERRANLADAFSWNQKAEARFREKEGAVAVVDDIYTTGSTMNACATVLKRHGVTKVYGICVCVGGET